jgi:hypothetical protein
MSLAIELRKRITSAFAGTKAGFDVVSTRRDDGDDVLAGSGEGRYPIIIRAEYPKPTLICH